MLAVLQLRLFVDAGPSSQATPLPHPRDFSGTYSAASSWPVSLTSLPPKQLSGEDVRGLPFWLFFCGVKAGEALNPRSAGDANNEALAVLQVGWSCTLFGSRATFRGLSPMLKSNYISLSQQFVA